MTPSQSDRFRLVKEIEETKKKDPEKARDMLTKAFADEKLTPADLKQMKLKASKPDYLVRKVSRLQPGEAVDVLRLTTKEERDSIKNEVLKKIANSQSINSSEKKRLLDDYKEIMASKATPSGKKKR
jgi:hypothetical protein